MTDTKGVAPQRSPAAVSASATTFSAPLTETLASRFTDVASFQFEGVAVRHFTSVTGMTVLCADIPGPLTHGYIGLSTLADDDAGIPHVLEHMIFMASKRYPYKGLLDAWANRSLAQGTNAWTATDHTAYTVATAGTEGFLALLPTYLEHVLAPALSDAAFATEVHHIAPDGTDRGVVYCEMEAIANEAETLVWNELLRAVFGHESPYARNTGGDVEAMRSLTPDRVRAFHAKQYVPANTVIVVSGRVDPLFVLDRVAIAEDDLQLPHHRGSPYPRLPLSTAFAGSFVVVDGQISPSALVAPVDAADASSRTQTIVVPFPTDEFSASSGSAVVAVDLCEFADTTTPVAFDALTEFLTADASRPLRRALIETENGVPSVACELHCSRLEHGKQTALFSFRDAELDALEVGASERLAAARLQVPVPAVPAQAEEEPSDASSDAASMNGSSSSDAEGSEASTDTRGQGHSVPLTADDLLVPRLRSALAAVAATFSQTEFSQVSDALDLLGHQVDQDLELSPHQSAAEPLIQYAMTGVLWSTKGAVATLRTKPLEYWRDLCLALAAAPMAVVIGMPDPAFGRQQQVAEAARVEAQVARLGPEGLQQAASDLAAAKAEHRAPPPAVVAQFQPPPTASALVGCHRIDASPLLLADGSPVPAVTVLRSSTRFVGLGAFFDVSGLPPADLAYLVLVRDALLEFPVALPDGSIRSSDAHSALLTERCLDTETDVGFDASSSFLVGPYFSLLGVAMSCVIDRAGTASELVADSLLRAVHTDPEIIGRSARRLLQDQEGTRQAYSVCSAAANELIYASQSVPYITNQWRQHRLLKPAAASATEWLSTPAGCRYVSAVDRIRACPLRLRLHVPFGMSDEALRVWLPTELLARCTPPTPPVTSDKRDILTITPSAGPAVADAVVVPLASCDGAYVSLTRACDLPATFSRQHAALLIGIEAISALEGPLWRVVRGSGLAYGCVVSASADRGLVTLDLYRTPCPSVALRSAASVVRRAVTALRHPEADPGFVDVSAARSSAIYTAVHRTATIADASDAAYVSVTCRNQPVSAADVDFVTHMSEVTADEAAAMLETHVLPLFAVVRPADGDASTSSQMQSVDTSGRVTAVAVMNPSQVPEETGALSSVLDIDVRVASADALFADDL
jgi:Zn-dependent M16 (insulinase) family peptidase